MQVNLVNICYVNTVRKIQISFMDRPMGQNDIKGQFRIYGCKFLQYSVHQRIKVALMANIKGLNTLLFYKLL